jgi:hypothetical protein
VLYELDKFDALHRAVLNGLMTRDDSRAAPTWTQGDSNPDLLATSQVRNHETAPDFTAAAALAALLRSLGFEKVTVVFEQPPAT